MKVRTLVASVLMACAILLLASVAFASSAPPSGGNVAAIQVPVLSPTWQPGPPISPARYAFQGGVASDGNVYVAGGQDAANITMNDAQAYHPSTNSWSAIAPLPVALGQVALGASGGKVYAAGGWPGGTSVVNTLYIYDVATNAWTTGANMPLGTEASAGVVLNGKFYVIGGDDYNFALNSVYVYDIATDTWSTGPNLPDYRTNTAATASGGLIYVFGGLDSSFTNAIDSLLVYDPATTTWTDLGSSGSGGLGNYGGVSRYGTGKLFVVDGGDGSFTPSNATQIYDIATNTWSAGPALSVPHLGHAQSTLPDGRVIVASGITTSFPQSVTNAVELLDAQFPTAVEVSSLSSVSAAGSGLGIAALLLTVLLAAGLTLRARKLSNP